MTFAIGYTSYDYAAVIREDRAVDREKYSAAKLLAQSLQASPEYLTAVPTNTSMNGSYTNNPDISVLIEGHTDNDKITGTIGGGVENNWDLSTKRATAIVNILSANAKVKKENLTAAINPGLFYELARNMPVSLNMASDITVFLAGDLHCLASLLVTISEIYV